MNRLGSSASADQTAMLASDGPEPGAPLLQMRGSTKSFFGGPVLDAVDLDVLAGEAYAVVGEKGRRHEHPDEDPRRRLLTRRGKVTQIHDGANEIQNVVVALHVLAAGDGGERFVSLGPAP